MRREVRAETILEVHGTRRMPSIPPLSRARAGPVTSMGSMPSTPPVVAVTGEPYLVSCPDGERRHDEQGEVAARPGQHAPAVAAPARSLLLHVGTAGAPDRRRGQQRRSGQRGEGGDRERDGLGGRPAP
ncbi:hypothetical protein [Nonomuraea dietziae]|uniref:hypothetical protein n=1 Tax=Nonomuraea dietziae TaxID=65515 RepID=UPI0031D8E7B9